MVRGIVVEEVDVDGGFGFAEIPCVGVIDTSWKIPDTGWKTMTIAGVLRDAPRAQVGWQLFTFRVPEPCPPASAPHVFQVMAVTVIAPVAHPTVRLAGRMCGFGAGAQERTAGSGPAVVDVVELVVGEAGS